MPSLVARGVVQRSCAMDIVAEDKISSMAVRTAVTAAADLLVLSFMPILPVVGVLAQWHMSKLFAMTAAPGSGPTGIDLVSRRVLRSKTATLPLSSRTR